MKKFNMERIFKRSQKNKESYFGAELYAWPLMFFPTFDVTTEINIFCKSDAVDSNLSVGGITAFPGAVYGKITNCIN